MTKDEVDRYGHEVLAFLTERLDRMGEADSGLYHYYAYRVAKGHPILDYERFLLRYLSGERGPVFHAGIGIGVLTAALARHGMPCVGWESDERRFFAAEAARDVLAPGHRYDLRHGNFPDAFRLGDRVGNGTLIFTNVGASWSDRQLERIIDTMRYFSNVILDLRLFGDKRDLPEERDALAARFKRAGFRVRAIDTRLPDAFYVSLVPRGLHVRASLRVRAREVRLAARRAVAGRRARAASALPG